MSGARRRYSREFKIDAIRRIIEDGQTQQHVARDLGVSANTLAAWKREYLEDREQAFPGNGRQKPDDAELTRLRRENARLKREVEILKKAAAYFARESQ
jgi:transposase